MGVISLPPLAPGRKYLCVAPHCWGADPRAEQAIKKAKKNRVPMYEGPDGWRYVLYDVQDDAYVDEMGRICYVPREQVVPYREVLRYKVKPVALNAKESTPHV